ncbi:MAG: ATP-binding protein [Bacteroidales bacterium]|nr:ATP-binding protein [Bacteroidales bacterium]
MPKHTTFKTFSVLNLIEKIVEKTAASGNFKLSAEVKPYLDDLSTRLGITQIQALLLSVLVDQSDDMRIRPRDIARHFECRTISVLASMGEIDALVDMGVIAKRFTSNDEVSFRVPKRTLDALSKGVLPEKESVENLSALAFVTAVDNLMTQREDEEIKDEALYDSLEELLDKNQHLEMARKIKSFALDGDDLVLYFAIALCFINNNDDRVCRGDIDDYFSSGNLRRHCMNLQSGSHVLIHAKLVEHSCIDGQVEPNSWMLTDYSKVEVFSELSLKKKVEVKAGLTRREDIVGKNLFYTPGVQKQVSQLESMLDGDRMKRILTKLSDKGLRKGFACLFYGAPGTGKTETVLQLAKRTGRDIMLVDIPSIRDKWVGETEKNIQAVFDRYRKAVDGNAMAPILVFNEADAILNKRSESSASSVDKMENAMQNIILQEMEKLEGIMIATTNLTTNLDPAFERRFLYKVEFEKPTYKERKEIWKSMLVDLSDEDATSLAKEYDFSGGQIENIARKRIISDILDDRDDVNLPAIKEACQNELIGKSSSSKRIAF